MCTVLCLTRLPPRLSATPNNRTANYQKQSAHHRKRKCGRNGATLLTGATVETPDQVSATIDLGDAGVVELQPNSQIKLDFDENGNVRVKVNSWLRGNAKENQRAAGRDGTLYGSSFRKDGQKTTACRRMYFA